MPLPLQPSLRQITGTSGPMGIGAASSKLEKKNSGEDRRKRKNAKSRKRRRVSLSSSPYSSGPDDVLRHRRSSHRNPGSRRGRDPKRFAKRKSRKDRHRSVSSTRRDSCSCSQSRSRSPVLHRHGRKCKLNRKTKRGRKRDRCLRTRDRYTCSHSSCSSQKHSYRDVKVKERDGSRQIGSYPVVASPGKEEEGYGNRGRAIDNELIMINYEDSQLQSANAELDVARAEEENRGMNVGLYEQVFETDRWMGEDNVVNESYFDQFENKRTQLSETDEVPELNLYPSSRIKSEIVASDKHNSDADDLELMLRKKALENLKKLRGGFSSDKKATDRKNELAGNETSEKGHETATKIISSSESHSIALIERNIQSVVPSYDSKANPVVELPPLEANYSISDKKTVFSRLSQSRHSNQLESSISGQNISNLLNDAEYSFEKMPHRQSPCRGFQERNAMPACGSANSLESEVNFGDGLAFENAGPNGKGKILENNAIVDECQSGSQFEQKTFSRMHDGEMVQVSYKVYIPKKTTALARRKLQQ